MLKEILEYIKYHLFACNEPLLRKLMLTELIVYKEEIILD
jgi:hypothetical protein